MDERFPLPYQIVCIVLTALFALAFSISREPRVWRRFYQAKFGSAADFSVNRNKVIDESLKKYGILVAMFFLVVDVGFFVAGVTHRYRMESRQMSKDDLLRLQEQQKIQGSSPGDSRRSMLP